MQKKIKSFVSWLSGLHGTSNFDCQSLIHSDLNYTNQQWIDAIVPSHRKRLKKNQNLYRNVGLAIWTRLRRLLSQHLSQPLTSQSTTTVILPRSGVLIERRMQHSPQWGEEGSEVTFSGAMGFLEVFMKCLNSTKVRIGFMGTILFKNKTKKTFQSNMLA